MSDKVKLLMSWDIRADQEASTFEFMANESRPGDPTTGDHSHRRVVHHLWGPSANPGRGGG